MTIANRARSVLVIVPTVFVLMFDPAWSQHTDRATREILELQDSRSLGNGKLVTYLSNHDAKLRFRALVALANIQDTSTLSAVTPLLQDKVRGEWPLFCQQLRHWPGAGGHLGARPHAPGKRQPALYFGCSQGDSQGQSLAGSLAMGLRNF